MILIDFGAEGAVVMGYGDGEETRLYGADPPARDIWVGRAVLARHGRHRVIQVAHTSPEV